MLALISPAAMGARWAPDRAGPLYNEMADVLHTFYLNVVDE